MTSAIPTRRFQVASRHGPADRVVVRRQSGGDRQMLVLAGYRGPELPPALTDPVIEPDAAGNGWQLRCREGSFCFEARAVDRIAEQPELFTPLHQPFALSAIDRMAVRAFLWLLRLPGGARLMRAWHDRHIR